MATLVVEGLLSIAHVGDSRPHLARDGKLVRLTRNDSWAATVLGRRPFDAVTVEQLPMRHVLTNVLGPRTQTEIHMQERSIKAGDLLVICRDGLHGSMDDRHIREALAHHKTVEATAEGLRAALDRGSRDKVTAIVLTCE
jgi:serine/threonine protein phosphatase PrpC